MEPTSGTMITINNQTSLGRFRTIVGSLAITSNMQKTQRASSAIPRKPSPKIMGQR